MLIIFWTGSIPNAKTCIECQTIKVKGWQTILMRRPSVTLYNGERTKFIFGDCLNLAKLLYLQYNFGFIVQDAIEKLNLILNENKFKVWSRLIFDDGWIYIYTIYDNLTNSCSYRYMVKTIGDVDAVWWADLLVLLLLLLR